MEAQLPFVFPMAAVYMNSSEQARFDLLRT
jgi:hypothetical protein